MKRDRFDKMVLDAYWLYKDNLIIESDFLNLILKIKDAANDRRLRMYNEEKQLGVGEK